MGLGYQQFSLKRHLINSSQLQCEKSLKFCDPVIWNSIIVQSDCSPRELSAKSIGIAFPKKVPERARSNFITKEHSKVITFIITFLKCLKSSHFSLLSQSHFHYHKQRKTQTKLFESWKLKELTTYHHLNTPHGVMPRTGSHRGCDNHDNHVIII